MPEGVAWQEALACAWEELFQGTLALVHQGCSYYALLVVTGARRGRVVYVNLDGCGTPYFVRHPDFLSWYERWLDELLWGYGDFWFGFGLPGREEDMIAVLRGGDASADLRNEALSTLARIPTLAEETLGIVRAALRDASPGVRGKTAHLLGKHGVSHAAADIAGLLGDERPSVRKAALESLTKLPGIAWESAARSALQDASAEVVFRALCLLKDARLLRRSDVEASLRSADPVVRRNALWASDAVIEGAGQVVVPDELFFDADKGVRREAVLSAGGRKDRSKTPALLDLLRRETEVELLSCLVSALGNIGDRTAAPALIEMTRHTDGFVRQDAARALGKLGDRRAIPALRALLSDHTKPVRTDERGLTRVSSSRSVADEGAGRLVANPEILTGGGRRTREGQAVSPLPSPCVCRGDRHEEADARTAAGRLHPHRRCSRPRPRNGRRRRDAPS